jgi:uncharacterized protein Yka (UPF0111/DUF47 family)
MNEITHTLEKTLELALTLSPIEKVRLVEKVMATLENDLRHTAKSPKRDLAGLWSEVEITEEDIDEVRREMWANFPREDI